MNWVPIFHQNHYDNLIMIMIYMTYIVNCCTDSTIFMALVHIIWYIMHVNVIIYMYTNKEIRKSFCGDIHHTT